MNKVVIVCSFLFLICLSYFFLSEKFRPLFYLLLCENFDSDEQGAMLVFSVSIYLSYFLVKISTLNKELCLSYFFSEKFYLNLNI
uniref:Putative ovule protein n=1 Tax=Solanum chacoense TaxID=4108 RepID=A0A0V0GYF9_SOLCH